MKRLRNGLFRALLIGVIVVAAGALLGWRGTGAGDTISVPANDVHRGAIAADDEAAVVPKDTCLTCHVLGASETEDDIWLPLARWAAFGVAGMILAVGVWRSASLWTRRKPWRGLWARAVDYIDARYDIVAPLKKALDRPVPRWSTHWLYCLGGLTFTAFIIQAVTGVMLAFYYKPDANINPETGLSYAYESINYIMEEVQGGALTRTVHHWTANLMIVLCVAHMARVFIMGAYRAPRELNWVSGVVLLILTLAFGFTGYLLPWDQKAFWATTVGSDIAGKLPVIGKPTLIFLRDGWMVTDLTLNRFYGLHVIVIPVITVVFMGLHFLMVRRLGVKRPL